MQKLIVELKDALSEVKQFETERNSFVAELETKNKELEAFSYSVSHDLRSPLRTIKDLAGRLAEHHQDNLTAEEKQYADNINLTVEHMDHFIDDLLAYGRLGSKIIKLRTMPLGFVIAQVKDVLAPRIKETGAVITIDDDLPDISGDQTLLLQIFSNLIDNSLTYCHENCRPEVSITWQQDNRHAIICVADKGIGIPLEQQEHIFEMFYRLHSQDEYPGTGIGLAIVKKAVEMQGGTVWIESAVNRGSKFYISLLLPS
jgi:light-regulated signal transduction histidine kinase (bacteriophytochrome)